MDDHQPDPDEQLLHQFKTGAVDEDAWRQFLRRLRAWIGYHYPALLANADDLAAEAAVAAFVSVHSFRGQARFIRWVHGIAYHMVCKQLRRQGEVVVLSFEDLREEVAAPDEIDRRLLQVAVDAALQTLTPQERAVFLSRVRDDTSHKQIAQQLGISENASRQTWVRAAEKIGHYRLANSW